MQEAWILFPLIDCHLYPLMDAAGIGDLIKVDVMRISPDDQGQMFSGGNLIEGKGLEGFSGFLKRSARENDLLWGRLHGANRLLDLLAAGSGRSPDDLKNLRRSLFLQIVGDEAARAGTSISAGAVISRF